jgi:hypothetical protein
VCVVVCDGQHNIPLPVGDNVTIVVLTPSRNFFFFLASSAFLLSVAFCFRFVTCFFCLFLCFAFLCPLAPHFFFLLALRVPCFFSSLRRGSSLGSNFRQPRSNERGEKNY